MTNGEKYIIKNIDDLHDKLFDLICVVTDICANNGVTIFLDGGTEIGAVREKDFIAWDDDVDLKIFTEEYFKFVKVMEENLPPHLHLIEPTIYSPYFLDFVIRIYDDRYLLRESKDEDYVNQNLQNYVCTDIFLYSEAAPLKLIHKANLIKIIALYGAAMSHRHCFEKEKYTILQRMVIGALKVLGKYYSMEKIWEKYQKIIFKRYKGAKYRYPANGLFKHYNLLVPMDVFNGVEYAPIRDKLFPIPKGYDEDLTIFYGDYMTPQRDPNIYIVHTEFVENV